MVAWYANTTALGSIRKLAQGIEDKIAKELVRQDQGFRHAPGELVELYRIREEYAAILEPVNA
jgi:hypothetical protein